MKEKLFSEEIAILKKHGLRATHQRMQILQAFISLKGVTIHAHQLKNENKVYFHFVEVKHS
ncbi:hypothetical protein [Bacillus cereus]|uniref:Uncharacterized protein n=1 Tax=Bacillus cereus TaxID=1396 RepID=A0A2B1KVB0_BACCE|nr:hypothetical protein [Bacillus cereus]PFN28016.1 hypothetical protein COJ50_06090 [Bacillus cereus]